MASGRAGDPGAATRLIVAVDITAAAGHEIEALNRAASAAPCTVIWLASSAERLPRDCPVSLDVAVGGHGVLRERPLDVAEVPPDAEQSASNGGPEPASMPRRGPRSRPSRPTSCPATCSPICAGCSPPWSTSARRPRPARSPDAVPLTDVLHLRSISDQSIASSWSRQRGPTIALPLGRARTAPVVATFQGDADHGYVIGPLDTGAGTFLQTVLSSATLVAPPTHLNLVLISSAASSPVGSFSAVPHLAASIVGLERDPSLAGRAVVSLRTEIARRRQIARGRRRDEVRRPLGRRHGPPAAPPGGGRRRRRARRPGP